MAINITFDDFDTVCYSNQHNIIELIHRAVGISVEINILDGNVTEALNQANQANNNVTNLYNQLYNSGGAGGGGPGDIGILQQLVDIMREQLNDLNTKMNDVYNYSFNFRESGTGRVIRDLEARVTALESKVG